MSERIRPVRSVPPPAPVLPVAPVAGAPRWRALLPWGLAGLFAVAFVVVLAVLLTRGPGTQPHKKAQGPIPRKDFEHEVMGVEIGKVREKYGPPHHIDPASALQTIWYYEGLTINPDNPSKPDRVYLIVNGQRVREVGFLR